MFSDLMREIDSGFYLSQLIVLYIAEGDVLKK